MRVRIKTVMDGPGQSEAVVAIHTKGGGEEELVVQKNEIKDDTIEVGRVGEQDKSVLIELPHESASGNWRLWVDSNTLK